MMPASIPYVRLLTAILFVLSINTDSPTNINAQDPSQSTQPSYVHASYEGFAEAISDVQVSTDEVGRLTDVPVKLGDRVVAGQTIAQLDDRIERASLAIAETQASMNGEIEVAKASRDLQAYRLEQLQSLHDKAMAGTEELRRAQMELDVAKARLLMAVEQQRLRLAECKRLELQVQERRIVAPFDGLVADKRLQTGAAVTPSSPIILRLVRIDALIGVFNVPAEHSFAMKPNMATQIYFRAARQTVDGVIDSMSPAINGESGTVQVRIKIENADGELRPGDRCSMRVTPGQPMANRPTSNAASFQR